jgi:hypothetical protein
MFDGSLDWLRSLLATPGAKVDLMRLGITVVVDIDKQPAPLIGFTCAELALICAQRDCTIMPAIVASLPLDFDPHLIIHGWVRMRPHPLCTQSHTEPPGSTEVLRARVLHQ